MRAFIAIDLDQKDYFEDLQDQFPVDSNSKIKLTKAYHLTLKFLGEIPEKQIDEIKSKLSQIKFKSFKITLSKPGVFPSENYIRVIWIGLKDNREIINLQKEIEKSLLEIFPKDERFHPHLTLARVKFVKDREIFIRKLKAIKIKLKEMTIKEFKLIKSELTPKGPVYEDLTIFNLK